MPGEARSHPNRMRLPWLAKRKSSRTQEVLGLQRRASGLDGLSAWWLLSLQAVWHICGYSPVFWLAHVVIIVMAFEGYLTGPHLQQTICASHNLIT